MSDRREITGDEIEDLLRSHDAAESLHHGPWTLSVRTGHRACVLDASGTIVLQGFSDEDEYVFPLRLLADSKNALLPLLWRLGRAEQRLKAAEAILADMAEDGKAVQRMRQLREALRAVSDHFDAESDGEEYARSFASQVLPRVRQALAGEP